MATSTPALLRVSQNVQRVEHRGPERGKLCGFDGLGAGRQPAQRTATTAVEGCSGLTKVRVASSNLVIRSRYKFSSAALSGAAFRLRGYAQDRLGPRPLAPSQICNDRIPAVARGERITEPPRRRNRARLLHDGLDFSVSGSGLTRDQVLGAAALASRATPREWAELTRAQAETPTVGTETTAPAASDRPEVATTRDVPVNVTVEDVSANEHDGPVCTIE